MLIFCIGTLLLRYDGSKVAVEDVKEGDLLLGPDGGPRRAFNIVSGKDRLYRIKIGPREEDLVVTANHILVLHREKEGMNKYDGPASECHDNEDEDESPSEVSSAERYDTVMTTAAEFAALDPKERQKHRAVRCPGFDLPEQPVPVNRSFLGQKACERFTQTHSLRIKDIRLESDSTEWAGFRVDKDQLYLRHDYLVLHNSGFEEVCE